MSFPSVEELAMYYEARKADVLRKRLPEPAEWQALEGIHHEALALDIVVGFANARGLRVDFGLDDLNPHVRDSEGVLCELDFRLRIEGDEILFGATRFSFNGRDLGKDIDVVDVPIWDLKINGMKQRDGRARIVSVQSRASVLRRKIAVRIAKEGRHRFQRDHVYLLFWYEHPRSTWPDTIPESFAFEQRSPEDYDIKEGSFSGLCLVGREKAHEGLFELRTHTFPRGGEAMRRLLSAMNRRRIRAV
jgi:hypothetical protein